MHALVSGNDMALLEHGLAAVEIGNQIPIAAFAAVAEILVYIYRANRAPPQPPQSHPTGAAP